MVTILKPNAEYNRKAAIIEGLRARRSATEIIRFFRYPRSTFYDIVAKYMALEQSNEDSRIPARKSHSKERTARIPAVVEKVQALILDDSGQSLRSDGCREAVDGNYGVQKVTCFSAGWCIVHTNHLIQNWLSDNIDMF